MKKTAEQVDNGRQCVNGNSDFAALENGSTARFGSVASHVATRSADNVEKAQFGSATHRNRRRDGKRELLTH